MWGFRPGAGNNPDAHENSQAKQHCHGDRHRDGYASAANTDSDANCNAFGNGHSITDTNPNADLAADSYGYAPAGPDRNAAATDSHTAADIYAHARHRLRRRE